MKNANCRKHNDRSHNSSTYHKKDGTPIRAILDREAQNEIAFAIEELERQLTDAYFVNQAQKIRLEIKKLNNKLKMLDRNGK